MAALSWADHLWAFHDRFGSCSDDVGIHCAAQGYFWNGHAQRIVCKHDGVTYHEDETPWK